MIKKIPYAELGHADHGWLNARYHFSFSQYHNPERMGFGKIRVINDDLIDPQKGFEPHSHKNMEIITFVRKGAITHRDDKGNEGRTEAGDVQVMSAGTGITHSEFNLEEEVTNLYQIWIMPKALNVAPDWDSHQFPKEATTEKLELLVSGDGTAPLYIHQDAWIYGGKLPAKTQLNHTIKNNAYLLVSEGEVMVDDSTLTKGDGAEISQQNSITLKAQSDAEVLLIDVPA